MAGLAWVAISAGECTAATIFKAEFKVFFPRCHDVNLSIDKFGSEPGAWTDESVTKTFSDLFVKVGCQILFMALMYRPLGRFRFTWHLERYRRFAWLSC